MTINTNWLTKAILCTATVAVAQSSFGQTRRPMPGQPSPVQQRAQTRVEQTPFKQSTELPGADQLAEQSAQQLATQGLDYSVMKPMAPATALDEANNLLASILKPNQIQFSPLLQQEYYDWCFNSARDLWFALRSAKIAISANRYERAQLILEAAWKKTASTLTAGRIERTITARTLAVGLAIQKRLLLEEVNAPRPAANALPSYVNFLEGYTHFLIEKAYDMDRSFVLPYGNCWDCDLYSMRQFEARLTGLVSEQIKVVIESTTVPGGFYGFGPGIDGASIPTPVGGPNAKFPLRALSVALKAGAHYLSSSLYANAYSCVIPEAMNQSDRIESHLAGNIGELGYNGREAFYTAYTWAKWLADEIQPYYCPARGYADLGGYQGGHIGDGFFGGPGFGGPRFDCSGQFPINGMGWGYIERSLRGCGLVFPSRFYHREFCGRDAFAPEVIQRLSGYGLTPEILHDRYVQETETRTRTEFQRTIRR